MTTRVKMARCTRCNTPTPGHPDATTHGGMPAWTWLNDDAWCLVCLDQALGNGVKHFIND